MQAGVEGEWVGIKKDFEAEESRRKEREREEAERKGRRRGSISGLKAKVKGGRGEGEEKEGSDDGLEGECEWSCGSCGRLGISELIGECALVVESHA